MAEKKEEKKTVPVNEDLGVAVDAVLRTEYGRKVWAHLAKRCGFFQSSLSRRADGEIAALSTEAKEAQRLIYLEFRDLASPELRAVAEQLAEFPPIVGKKSEEERKK